MSAAAVAPDEAARGRRRMAAAPRPAPDVAGADGAIAPTEAGAGVAAPEQAVNASANTTPETNMDARGRFRRRKMSNSFP